LVHNTGPEAHELKSDPVYGYGIPNLTRMLSIDPVVTYPDINPLASDVPAWDGDLVLSDIAVKKEPGASSSPADQTTTPTAPATTPEEASSSTALVLVLVVVGAVILVLVVLGAVALAKRKDAEV